MGFDEVLRLSYKRFWFLLAQIARFEAEEDLRLIRTGVSSTSAESYEAANKHFEGILGEIYTRDRTEPVVMKVSQIDPETGLDPEFDRAGLHALKAQFLENKG